MIKLALVGKNIAHSKSQTMYEKIFNTKIDYTLLDYGKAEEIPTIEILSKEYMGISITAPYKSHFLSQVEVSPDIASLGAINCIAFRDGSFLGTNTDYLAVLEILQEEKYKNRNVVVLGDGAMSRVTKLVLDKIGKEAIFLNRKKDGNLNDVDYSSLYKENMLLINACAREFHFKATLPQDTIFWDYNYSHTLNSSSLLGMCEYVDGIDLLFTQAKFATKFWKLSNK